MSAADLISPLDMSSRSGRFGAAGTAPLVICERRMAIAQLIASKRRDAEVHAAARSILGVGLPKPGHAATAGAVTAIWIAPFTWILTRDGSPETVFSGELAASFEGAAAIVDQTCGKAVLRLSGLTAREVLAKGCRVDLHTRVFGPGRAVVTPVFHIQGILIQVDATPTFDLVVPSTLAADFLERLCLAAGEFGGEIKA